jgi:hypothetical protein
MALGEVFSQKSRLRFNKDLLQATVEVDDNLVTGYWSLTTSGYGLWAISYQLSAKNRRGPEGDSGPLVNQQSKPTALLDPYWPYQGQASPGGEPDNDGSVRSCTLRLC